MLKCSCACVRTDRYSQTVCVQKRSKKTSSTFEKVPDLWFVVLFQTIHKQSHCKATKTTQLAPIRVPPKGIVSKRGPTGVLQGIRWCFMQRIAKGSSFPTKYPHIAVFDYFLILGPLLRYHWVPCPVTRCFVAMDEMEEGAKRSRRSTKFRWVVTTFTVVTRAHHLVAVAEHTLNIAHHNFLPSLIDS